MDANQREDNMARIDKLPGKFWPQDKAKVSNDYPLMTELRNQHVLVLQIYEGDLCSILYLNSELTIHTRWLQHVEPMYRTVPDTKPSDQFSTDECQCPDCKGD